MKINSVFALFLVVAISLTGCDNNTSKSKQTTGRRQVVVKMSSMQLPVANENYAPGDPIRLEIEYPDTLNLDSLELFFRGEKMGVYQSAGQLMIPTEGLNPGAAGVRARLHFRGHSPETHSRQVVILSDIIPEEYKYRVVNTYPHDVGAYTQGLIYYDGWLYEGTGNRGQSTVRKVRLETGEVVQVRNNSSDIFGEGITIYEGKIYQLTYKAQICYVYELDSFDEIHKFYFQNKEGWGLTHNGTELIMSDGSNVIYFIDPNMFTVKRQIEVYNNEGPVPDLNELEYIDGTIFANRYYHDEIVLIDPESGKEKGRVNLKGILPVKERKPSTDVLNGIAWDAGNERLFVTGKNWPKLFEIEIYR